MFVIGTAGHVDHGKSTLVRTLTGIDPDRLREEKERGLTIELGFAWMTLPSGREVSLVDVPGHERFIKNMLMGIGGVDVALVVVAADEGVMPQTREHVAIVDLLGIRHGVVAVTKSDLADDDLLALVTDDVNDLLKGTSLAGSPVIPVSAQSSIGLDSLQAALDTALDSSETRRDLGRPRLPVDRSFTVSGFGTVVTGTLADGTLQTGQEVEILPAGRTARIRGLQSHDHPIEKAEPGSRVAVNLSGIDHALITRGSVITIPGWLRTSTVFDASFRTVAGAPRPVRHNLRVTLFASTFEVEATMRILGSEQLGPGEDGWVQIKTDSPVPLVKGDHFVIRDSNDTLGGGKVVELMPPRHRRNDPAVLQRLEALAAGGSEDAVLAAIDRIQPASVQVLARAANLSEDDAEAAVEELVNSGLVVAVGSPGLVFTAEGWERLRSTATDSLKSHHRHYPLRSGMQREEFRNHLKLKSTQFAAVLNALQQDGLVAAEGSTVRLPDHVPQPSPQQSRELDRFRSALAQNRFAPPTTSIDPDLLQLLVQRGEVVRAADDVVYLSDAYREMVDALLNLARQKGEITIDDVRSLFGTSRKYTLAVLEQMDRDNLTIRRGDARVLRN